MYVAVDLGAESGRVIAGDLERLDVLHRFPGKSQKIQGHLYWDAPAIFSEILIGLKTAFTRYGHEISSIGIDTWGVDYALLDETGAVLGNPFHYRDSRTDGVMEELRERLGDRRIYEASGIQFLPFNTIYQLSEEVKNRAGRLKAAADFLTIPDLLNYWLCGVKANEFSNATTTQLYDPREGDWAWELIDDLGIPRRIFGRIVPSGTVLGPLSDDVRREIGAPEGVRVIAPACHDTGSAVAAVPVIDDSPYAYLSSGTWSLLGSELDAPLINERTLEANFTNEGGAGGGFRFLKNIMGLWILQQCRREWETGGELPDYAEIVRQAEEAGPAGGFIDVDDPRFLKPGGPGDGMVQRVLRNCRENGGSVHDDMGSIARVILESLARRYADNLSALAELTGTRPERLYIIGGGSQNNLLNSLTARATGIPVSAGPVEATALGNLLMQALANGDIASIDEGRRIIGRSHPIRQFEP